MILTMALALHVVQAVATEAADSTRELTRIEHRLASTWRDGDCAGWGEMVAPEWSVIHLTGAVITRAEAMQMCQTPSAPIEAFEVDEIAVRRFGDAAVVTGRAKVVTGGSTPGQVTLRFTDVFVRRAGQWRAVASQATRVGS